MEALELFGVRANARTTAKTLKVQLVQLIQDQAPCSVVGDGMLVDREHILLHLEALVKIILVSIGRRGQLGELALTLFDLQRRQEFERVCERLT